MRLAMVAFLAEVLEMILFRKSLKEDAGKEEKEKERSSGLKSGCFDK